MKTYLRYVDLRSDTFSKPNDKMIDAMAHAVVGDDCYAEDPSVDELQNTVAELFGKEAALFCSSGTMSNLVGMLTLGRPGNEIIIDRSYHINFFESAQMSQFGGLVFNPCETTDGILTVEDVKHAIDSKYRTSLYASPKIVAVENTINSHGGKIFPLDKLKELYEYTKKNNLTLYMDGARIFNACAATNIDPKEYAKYTDCLSVCLSKGLGAPFGSVLIGSKEFIEQAKVNRKRVGGGLHQAGHMAAAALYALQHNMPKLKEDHRHIQYLAEELKKIPSIEIVNAATNMILFNVEKLKVNQFGLESSIDAKLFVDFAKRHGLLLIPWQENVVRMVTHLNVNDEDVVRAVGLLKTIVKNIIEYKHFSCKTYALYRMLEQKGLPAKLTEENEYVVELQLAGQAQEFFKNAERSNLAVHLKSNDVIALVVTDEHSREDLVKIANELKYVYLTTMGMKNISQLPRAARSEPSLSAHRASLFAKSTDLPFKEVCDVKLSHR